MTKHKAVLMLAVTPVFVLSGCFNMPTPSSQITSSYTSGLRYENFTCSQLAVELDSLARRENQLILAQEQRIKTSQIQAFWWGFGQGDGIEASELANVRGEKEAVRKAIDGKTCREVTTAATSTQPAKLEPQTKPSIQAEQQNRPNQREPYIYNLNIEK